MSCDTPGGAARRQTIVARGWSTTADDCGKGMEHDGSRLWQGDGARCKSSRVFPSCYTSPRVTTPSYHSPVSQSIQSSSTGMRPLGNGLGDAHPSVPCFPLPSLSPPSPPSSPHPPLLLSSSSPPLCALLPLPPSHPAPSPPPPLPSSALPARDRHSGAKGKSSCSQHHHHHHHHHPHHHHPCTSCTRSPFRS
jgi:hypothetical protein